MAKNANSILARIGIGGFLLLLIGAGAGIGIFSLFRKPVVKYTPQIIYEVKDTCAVEMDSFILIRRDSFEMYELREGDTLVDTDKPRITETRASTQNDREKITTFEKPFDWGHTSGVVEFKVRSEGTASLDEFKITYKADTIVNTTVIMEKNDIIIQPTIPNITVPAAVVNLDNSRKKTIYGGTGGLVYTDRLFYSAGIYMTTKRDITFKAQKFINSSGGEIEIMLPLSKVFNK